ncbi:hypothetical protein [Actinoplanes aureus]|uniref:Uncharacterized protein n=1 Tax=Actinoplanes aureus TaxID=2792083 RepID=A0A931G5S5_9ACTN|nr:hypothetical protein [Actinoplanes aureus]MBG0569146.1 hypothetical protein [Actinoplanes aureus]
MGDLPASEPAATGTTYVLQFGDRHVFVGPLLARTADPLTSEQAQQWARPWIGDTTIDWEAHPLDGPPGSGWATMDFLSGEQFMLHCYPDGWRLVRALSRGDGVTVESDTEACAWADRVVKVKDNVTGLHWSPGPTPDGVTTWYGTA